MTTPTLADIRLQLYRERERLFVAVKLNDRISGLMMLDTGASVSWICEDVKKQLSLAPIARRDMQRLTRVDQCDFVVVDSMAVGDLKISRVVLGSIPEKSSSANGKDTTIGVIGMDILGQQPFLIDFRLDLLVLNAKEPDEGKYLTFPLFPQTPLVEVQGTLEGTSGRFTIDTGYAGGLILSTPFERFNRLLFTQRPFVRTAGADEESGVYLGWESFSFLGRRLNGITSECFGKSGESGHTSGAVGARYLRDSILFVDLKRRQISVKWYDVESAKSFVARMKRTVPVYLVKTTPILEAVFQDRADAVDLLIADGEKPDESDQYGYTPIMIAAAHNNVKIVEALLAAGARMDVTFGEERHTALTFAAAYASAECVASLLRAGGDANTTLHRSGKSALYLAAESGNVTALRALIRAGARTDAHDVSGATVLIAAVRGGSVDCVNEMIKLNNDVNIVASGTTPLSCAIEAGRPDIVECLLKNGAKSDLRTAKGLTPLFIAAGSTRVEASQCIDLLLQHGANPAEEVNGRSALSRAIDSGTVENIQSLIRAKK